MKGLLIQDFSYLLENIKTYALMMLFFIVVFVVSGVNSAGIMGVLTFLAFTISLNSFAFDDINSWNKYALTMPLNRSDIVIGKYLYALLSVGVIMVITYVLTIVTGIINGEVGVELKNVALASIIVASIVIVFMSIIFPIIFKLGMEKARMLMIAIFIAPAIIVFLGMKLFPNGLGGLVNFFAGLEPVLTGVGYGVIILAILFISIRVSISIMEKKEF